MKELTLEFAKVGLEFTEDEEYMEVWKGEKFVTRFSSSYETACEVLEPYRNARLENEKSHREQFNHLANVSADFTKAAVINSIGEVIGLCETNAKTINVAGDFDASGYPVNVQNLKVSRSKTNLQLAEKLPMSFNWVEHGGRVIYCLMK